MEYNIQITPSAKREIREIFNYIAKELNNPDAALRRINLIDEKIQSLKENPARFPFVRDEYLSSKGYRWIDAKSHVIFYIIREQEKVVSIMRVLYSRRDWMRLIKLDENKTRD